MQIYTMAIPYVTSHSQVAMSVKEAANHSAENQEFSEEMNNKP